MTLAELIETIIKGGGSFNDTLTVSINDEPNRITDIFWDVDTWTIHSSHDDE